jgi:hypothetical protein
MKLALSVVALLTLAVPAAPVRYEAGGIRVGDDFVSGASLQVKGLDATTLLVSGSSVENLGAAVDVALDADHALKLQAGLRLERSEKGFLLRSHGPALVVEAAGVALRGAAAVPFTLTPKGFDFGALGALEGASFTAKAEAPALQDGPIVSPERELLRRRATRGDRKVKVFRGQNPTVSNAGADREVMTSLIQLSLDGSN